MAFLRSTTYPTFIMGDFNFDIRQPAPIEPTWLALLNDNFDNCFLNDYLPTFTSTHGNHRLLDYIFCSIPYSSQVRSSAQDFVNYAWTDHNLLSISFRASASNRGSGTWKANPMLAKLPSFRSGLIEHLLQVIDDHRYLAPDCTLSDQEIWDSLKVDVKAFVKSFQLGRNSWRTKALKRLQSKCNHIFRQYRHTVIWSTLLPSVEYLISTLQTEIAEVTALQAGTFWKEKGERSPGLLKRLACTLADQRDIPFLLNPSSSRLIDSTDDKTAVMS
ncbi:hypothetical protein A0J61_05054 [Choanephora cucurbitarum]|uniref:Endonuclease/exonuclease/phosphatase domain-containing protein n=1 Tax=Choanephora cucurbitarum TaxID=101091 RepID=A0A1C7NDN9_9FUNG|nr:hypothetical protein A0J61_05054 [Choanephora cucurbitarum]